MFDYQRVHMTEICDGLPVDHLQMAISQGPILRYASWVCWKFGKCSMTFSGAGIKKGSTKWETDDGSSCLLRN